ncbi:McrC family protein [Priestia megaterium]|uniref:McrC family protein n=1 Tax=Priestia megaterium TaxID=1404 RepID=UPI003CEA6690
MKHIVLSECYDQLVISDEISSHSITQQQADELEQIIKVHKLDERNIIWGRKTITFMNYVGYIGLSNVSIEILPKISLGEDPVVSRKALLNMLKRSGQLNIKYSTVSLLNLLSENLFEIFGYLYVVLLEKELKRGIYSDYISSEGNLNVLKGSLQIKEHIQNISTNKRTKIYCRYEELQSNNKLNQIYKATNELLLKKVRNINTLNKLKHCQSWFSEVDSQSFSPRDLNNITLNRLNQRFEPSFSLAKTFLSNLSPDFKGGKNKSFSILFEMNKLFESYISILINQCTDHKVQIQHQEHKLLVKEATQRQIYSLKPDVVISNGETELVIDTKWKQIRSLYNRHGAKREDLFQLYAYVTRYKEARSAILLYPHNSFIEEDPATILESWYLDGLPEKRIRMYSISLEDEKVTIDNLTNIIQENFVV